MSTFLLILVGVYSIDPMLRKIVPKLFVLPVSGTVLVSHVAASPASFSPLLTEAVPS